jgi:hypothetical protein
VILPQNDADRDEDNEKEGAELSMKQIYNHPFKRGALGFDDFNYNLHNPYVMIETS